MLEPSCSNCCSYSSSNNNSCAVAYNWIIKLAAEKDCSLIKAYIDRQAGRQTDRQICNTLL
jgi:hypothetical protein